jgi:hypothetical protein
VNPPSNPAAVQPVYFPQTFLPPETLAALRRVFRSMAVVQPGLASLPEEMRPFADSGFLKVLQPSGEGGDEAALKEYARWGERHHGGLGVAAAWGQERAGADALGADGTPFEIAAAIRRGRATRGGAVPEDPLRAAELFLRLAQEVDRQQHQVGRALSECDRRHGRLFDAVSGETRAAAGDEGPPPIPPGDHLPERMAAWARVFLSRSCALPVFVTHLPDAADWLCERSPAPLRFALADLPGLLTEPSPAGWAPDGGDAVALLTALARAPLTSVKDVPGSALPAVWVWAETPPEVFLARLLRAGAAAASAGGEPGRHTLVVQLPTA